MKRLFSMTMALLFSMGFCNASRHFQGDEITPQPSSNFAPTPRPFDPFGAMTMQEKSHLIQEIQAHYQVEPSYLSYDTACSLLQKNNLFWTITYPNDGPKLILSESNARETFTILLKNQMSYKTVVKDCAEALRNSRRTASRL